MNNAFTEIKGLEKLSKAWNVDLLNQGERMFIASQSLIAFNLIYLPHHFKLKPANFHMKLGKDLSNPDVDEMLVVGYRGCAKSTYCSLSFPIWSCLFAHYHFPLLINETASQMKVNITSIRKELTENPLIANDFPRVGKDLRFTEQAIEFPNDVYLLGRTRGMKIRGLRYRQYRPDVVMADDVEALEWVRKKENRDKTERWWNSEVVPAVDENKSKLIVIGNLLHRDALMMRLKKRDIYKVYEYPIVDSNGEITWKGKYPDMQAIEEQKKRVGNAIAWAREYELKIISEDEQIIKEEHIHNYTPDILKDVDHEGKKSIKTINGGTAFDLAISEKETADFTAGISGVTATYGGRKRLFITNILNKRLSFTDMKQQAKQMHEKMPLGSHVIVEDVGYQKAALQELKRAGLPVRPIRPVRDKTARLESIAEYIIDGSVLFPDDGSADELIQQLLGFGVEEHDDMVDALVYLIMVLLAKPQSTAIVGKVNAL